MAPEDIPTSPGGCPQRVHDIFRQAPADICKGTVSPAAPADIPRGRHGYPRKTPRISPEAATDIPRCPHGYPPTPPRISAKAIPEKRIFPAPKKKTSSPLSRPSVLKIDDKPRGGPTDWAEKRKTSGRRKTETPPADIPRGLHGYPKSPPRISPAADIPNGPNGQSQRDRGCLGRPLWNCP